MFRILCVALNVRDSDIHRALAKVLTVVRNVRVIIMTLQFVSPRLSNVLTALVTILLIFVTVANGKMEKEIQSLKVKRNISYAEAKKLVLDKTPNLEFLTVLL
ncbi:hypothetical protein AVEN_237577-1 [Araneus ventricosus]|uniref:Uncharacterized protein n=1 Tax=Araneus ventricosus TaxID=182803 RepID=A0A4Y2VRW2_ARAVE|nr:hypothetical protein AVEN_237577-1 [Araneus ventricosus]